MFKWLKSFFTKREDLFANLPDFCRYDPVGEVVVVDYKGIKAYFSKQMVEEFKKADIDYIKEYTVAIDQFLEEKEDEE